MARHILAGMHRPPNERITELITARTINPEQVFIANGHPFGVAKSLHRFQTTIATYSEITPVISSIIYVISGL